MNHSFPTFILGLSLHRLFISKTKYCWLSKLFNLSRFHLLNALWFRLLEIYYFTISSYEIMLNYFIFLIHYFLIHLITFNILRFHLFQFFRRTFLILRIIKIKTKINVLFIIWFEWWSWCIFSIFIYLTSLYILILNTEHEFLIVLFFKL